MYTWAYELKGASKLARETSSSVVRPEYTHAQPALTRVSSGQVRHPGFRAIITCKSLTNNIRREINFAHEKVQRLARVCADGARV